MRSIFGRCTFSARYRSCCNCMPAHNSGLVPKASAKRQAMSGETPDAPVTMRDRVTRLTLSFAAASVTVMSPKYSRRTSPGCGGLCIRVMFVQSFMPVTLGMLVARSASCYKMVFSNTSFKVAGFTSRYRWARSKDIFMKSDHLRSSRCFLGQRWVLCSSPVRGKTVTDGCSSKRSSSTNSSAFRYL